MSDLEEVTSEKKSGISRRTGTEREDQSLVEFFQRADAARPIP